MSHLSHFNVVYGRAVISPQCAVRLEIPPVTLADRIAHVVRWAAGAALYLALCIAGLLADPVIFGAAFGVAFVGVLLGSRKSCRLRTFVSIGFALVLSHAPAADARTLRWVGPITAALEDSVRAQQPSTLILTSIGGDYLVALRVGEYVRANRIRTIATHHCYSACTTIWIAGVTREAAGDTRLLFHVPSFPGCVGRPCADQRDEARALNEGYYAYLRRMGAPERLVFLIRNQPPSQPVGLRGNVLELADVPLTAAEFRELL